MAYDPRPPIYLYESLALLLGVQGTTCPDRLVSVSPHRVANFGVLIGVGKRKKGRYYSIRSHL